MTPERWRRVKPLLETALGLDSLARSDYVASVSRDDASIGDDVAALLESAERAGFLDEWRVGRVPVTPATVAVTNVTASGQATEVSLPDLAPYTRLAVSTRHRRYDIVLVAPMTGEVVVSGGQRFPEPVTAFIRQDTIRAGEKLVLRVGPRVISTTGITQIEILAGSDA